MSEAPTLRAILCADIVKSTPQLAANTPEAIARQQAMRTEILDPMVTTHHGTIFKDTGDGILVHFAGTSDALAAALAIQQAMRSRNQAAKANQTNLRIGITHGQVTIRLDGDLRGIPVNMADRVQGLAPPDGITVTKAFKDDVQSWANIKTDDWGPRSLKGFPDPIHVFRVRLPDDHPWRRQPHPIRCPPSASRVCGKTPSNTPPRSPASA